MSRAHSNHRVKEDTCSDRCVTVFVIDPDPPSAEFVASLAAAHKIRVERFDSGEDFWAAIDSDSTGCVVVEVDLPGISGIQLQERMSAAGIGLPIVMVAEEADVAVAVRAMKSGAIDFLQKPCHPLELWEATQAALEKDGWRRKQVALSSEIRSQLETLTDDEYLVMQMVLDGHPNKAIARRLEVSLRTVDFRRANILRKMQASSLIDLAQRLATIDGQPNGPGGPFRVVNPPYRLATSSDPASQRRGMS